VEYDFRRRRRIQEPEITSEDLANEITLHYGYDTRKGKFRSSSPNTIPSARCFTALGGKEIGLKLVQGTRHAEKVAMRFCGHFLSLSLRASFRHPGSGSIYLDPGDRVSLTDMYGIGDEGFDKATGEISVPEGFY